MHVADPGDQRRRRARRQLQQEDHRQGVGSDLRGLVLVRVLSDGRRMMMMPRTKETGERIQLQFRMSYKVRERLRKEAARRRVSVNYLIEKALEENLLKWEKEKL